MAVVMVERQFDEAADFVEKTDLYQVLPIKVSRVLEHRSARHARDRLGSPARTGQPAVTVLTGAAVR